MDSARLQPALLGGVFIGVLSALPFISAANCCCCLWVVAGGVLTVYLRQQNSPMAIQPSAVGTSCIVYMLLKSGNAEGRLSR